MTVQNPPLVVIHVPHASRAIPPDARAAMVLTDQELEQQLALLVDHHTDELFTLDGTVQCIAPVSRFVVDVERYECDAKEPMAERGMGAVYMRTTDGRDLRRPLSPAERIDLLDRYYRPHHRRLEALVGDALTAHGRALLIDGHSFPNAPLPCDVNQQLERPDICVGTDSYHTPASLLSAVVAASQAQGWTTEVDRPYQGTMVPLAFYGDARALSVMVEVNRRLYLDAPARRNDRFARVRAGAQAIMRAAITTAGKYRVGRELR